MKKIKLIKFLFFCALLLLFSCRNCNLVDCIEDGGFIKIKLLKDGHDALFGSEASINRDSIRFFNMATNFNDEYISYNDITKTMDLFINDTRTYILKIENIKTDTFIGNTIVTSTGECGCSSYQLTKVTMNGQVICEGVCENIIEIQL